MDTLSLDTLSRVHDVASGLLSQVDDTLARYGAPAEERIWELLRGGGLLPGDAVADAVAWHPAALTARAEILRRQWETQAGLAASLSGASDSSDWEGRAATAFHARLDVARRSLTGLEESSAALAVCFDELAVWLEQARQQLAYSLGRVLCSAEAVALRNPSLPDALSLHTGHQFGLRADLQTGPQARARASVAIGETVLTAVDLFWRGGLEIWQHHCHRRGSTGRAETAWLDTSARLETPAADLSATASITLRTDY